MANQEQMAKNHEQFKRLKDELQELRTQRAALSEKYEELKASGKFEDTEEISPELARKLEEAKENAALASQSRFKSQESKPVSRPGVRSRRGMIRL